MNENYEAAKKRMQRFIDSLGHVTDDMYAAQTVYMNQISKVLDDDDAVSILLDAFFDYITYELEVCFNYGVNEAIERTDSSGDMAALLTTVLIATGGFSFSDVASYHKEVLKQEIDYFNESGLSKDDLTSFISDPLNYVLSRGKDVNDFKSKMTYIKPGISFKTITSLEMLSKYIGVKSYDESLVYLWERQSIGYYIAYRGSSYDCPECDSFCNKVYKITDMHFPVHPRCCCILMPVSNPEDFLGMA